MIRFLGVTPGVSDIAESCIYPQPLKVFNEVTALILECITLFALLNNSPKIYLMHIYQRD